MSRLVALTALAVLISSLIGSALLATADEADGQRRWSAAQERQLQQRAAVSSSVERARARAPRATASGTCLRTVHVPGQGQSCRTASGMFVVPRRDGSTLQTHGPDLVSAVPGAANNAAGGFGVADSIVCSPTSTTRAVQLVYLLPSDYASGASNVHGDRMAATVPRLRQALLDAATIVDRRAGELVPGARRRLRVACDDDGLPSVRRVVLPRSAASYASAGGFLQMEEDLGEAGELPEFASYREQLAPGLRRVLAYYDAEFLPGIAGQGTMFDRESLLDTARRSGRPMRSNDPLISRTKRNINNNPPSGSLAVQYGSRDGNGVIVEPHHGDLLHELSHTMGAVQGNIATTTGAGHCIDGKDVMCYDDGGPSGAGYVETSCPAGAAGAPASAALLPNGEQFDCNADTYFHPAPPPGNPLTAPGVWHLGLTANETFSRSTATTARPKRVGRIRVGGSGTRRVVRWPKLAPTKGRTYEIGYKMRGAGQDWQFMTVRATSAIPMLRPRRTYDISVAAVDRRQQVGPRRIVRGVRAGSRDNTPPVAPGALTLDQRSGTSATVSLVLSEDNVRTTAYVVEQRVGRGRWTRIDRLAAPPTRTHPPGAAVTARISGLRRATTVSIRMRALDRRGNVSRPSRTIRVRR